jgi:hypothetical protein
MQHAQGRAAVGRIERSPKTVTAYDKAIAALLVPIITGLLVKYAGVNLSDANTATLTVLVLAAVTAFATWLVPNKVQTAS